MPVVMERTVSLDRVLLERADAKLHNFGWTFDEMVNRVLVAIVSTDGAPDSIFITRHIAKAHRRPGLLRGRVRIAKNFDAPDPVLESSFENSSI